jgi:hypothetical protein
MERTPEIGFKSYDRFFPSQDTMPAGGLGNLIAMPLQGLVRSSGNSVFIDETSTPYPDQWTYLSGIEPISRSRVEHLVNEASATGKILSVRIPLVEEDEEPWLAPPSRRRPPPAIEGALPSAVTIVHADQIYIPRPELPAPLGRAIGPPSGVSKPRVLCGASDAPIHPRQAPYHLLRGIDQPPHCAASRLL